MSKVYTESEIKTLVLAEVNAMQKLSAIGMAFTSDDTILAYDSAVREVGYTVPLSIDDDDIDIRNDWLIKRMRFYYFFQIRTKLLLIVENGDMKSSGIVNRLTNILSDLNKEFSAEKNRHPHIFASSTETFGEDTLVIPNGFINDRIGQDITPYSTDGW